MTEENGAVATEEKVKKTRAPRTQPKKFVVYDSATSDMRIDLSVSEVSGFLSSNPSLLVFPFDHKQRDYKMTSENSVASKFQAKTVLTYEG